MEKGYVLINLLPYRERIKKAQIKQFSLFIGAFVFIGFILLFVAHYLVNVQVESQLSKNSFLEDQIKVVDKKIKEIDDLKEKIKQTLSKRTVVEKLQINRVDAINIINDISANIPEGMVVKDIKKTGDKIIVVGNTLSNAKVSNYMSSLESTATFEKVGLVEIKKVTITNASSSKKKLDDTQQTNEFTISLMLERKEEDTKSKGKKWMDKSNKVENKDQK